MLDSIREIFDILGFQSDSVGFKYDKYKNFDELTNAFKNGKCPVVDVLRKYLYPGEEFGSHAMVATGIKETNGVKCIQLKTHLLTIQMSKEKFIFINFILTVILQAENTLTMFDLVDCDHYLGKMTARMVTDELN